VSDENENERTLTPTEAQVFRLAHRAHQQRVVQSGAQLNADLSVLQLGEVHITEARDSGDGGLVLVFAPS